MSRVLPSIREVGCAVGRSFRLIFSTPLYAIDFACAGSAFTHRTSSVLTHRVANVLASAPAPAGMLGSSAPSAVTDLVSEA